jgi:hypothetical protein
MPSAGVAGGTQGVAGEAPPTMSPTTTRSGVGAAFVTGAYLASGDPAIDRMIALEAACKRFGSPV